jgi:hypothetical protein
MTKHFQRCPANSKRFRSFVLYFGAAAMWLLAALAPDAARAQTASQQNADTAVDLFVQAGNAVGLPITPDEVDITKQIVECAVNGTSAGDCAKNMAVATVLKEVGAGPDMTAAANCLVSGKTASSCVGQALVNQLPAEAQPMANCVIAGGNVGDCTKQFAEGQILSQIPDPAKQIASCEITSPGSASCVTNAIVSQMAGNLSGPAQAVVTCLGGAGNAQAAAKCAASGAPPEVQSLVSCATANGASIRQCAAQFAATQVTDPTAKAAVTCLGTNDPQKCGTGVVAAQITPAAQAAVNQAIALITKLNPDASATDLSDGIKSGSDAKATMQDIVQVAQGLQTGNIAEVLEGGGPIIAETASNIILSIFLDPALASVLQPVVNAMIQNDVTAVKNGLSDLANGDPVGFTQVVFQWYATQYIQASCALIPDGSFKDTVCGALGSAISTVAKVGGGALKDILGAGKSILNFFGLWNPIDSIVSGAWDDLKDVVDDIFDPKKHTNTCTTDSASLTNYYNAEVAICARNMADNLSTSQSSTQAVVDTCNATFQHCAAIAPACAKMGSVLENAGLQLNETIGHVAAAYAIAAVPNFAQTAVKKGVDMCDPGFWADHMAEMIAPCQSMLDAAAPANPSCQLASYPDTDGQPPNPGGKQSASHYACRQAVYGMTQSLASLVGPGSQACQNQITAVEVTNILDHCHEVPVPGGIPGLVMKQCDPPFIPKGWLTPRPTFPFGIRPPWLIPAGGIIPLPLPKIILFPVVFTPNGNLTPKGPPKIVINPTLPRVPPRLVPATPPQANNGGTGGPSFVNGCSGNSPAAGCANGTKQSPMDQLGDNQINNGINGVAGTSGGGGFGPGRNAPKGLPIGGKPPGGIVIGGAGKPGTGGGTNGNTGNGAGKPAGPATGGGGPVQANGGGHGGIGMVEGNGGPPTGPAWGPRGTISNGRITPIIIKPKPAPAPDPQVDFGGCPGCGQGGGFVAPK